MSNQEEPLSAKEIERKEKLKAEESRTLAKDQARAKTYQDRETEIQKGQKPKEERWARDLAAEEVREQAKDKARKEVYLAREKIIAAEQEARRSKE